MIFFSGFVHIRAHQVFKSDVNQTMDPAILSTQDLKLGKYIKIPPRASFMAQFVLVQVGVNDGLFCDREGYLYGRPERHAHMSAQSCALQC